MKAIGYIQPTDANFSAGLQVFELTSPPIGPLDLLVKIKAVSVNPVDYKVRASRAGATVRSVCPCLPHHRRTRSAR